VLVVKFSHRDLHEQAAAHVQHGTDLELEMMPSSASHLGRPHTINGPEVWESPYQLLSDHLLHRFKIEVA
jgi:hypothetical protein